MTRAPLRRKIDKSAVGFGNEHNGVVQKVASAALTLGVAQPEADCIQLVIVDCVKRQPLRRGARFIVCALIFYVLCILAQNGKTATALKGKHAPLVFQQNRRLPRCAYREFVVVYFVENSRLALAQRLVVRLRIVLCLLHRKHYVYYVVAGFIENFAIENFKVSYKPCKTAFAHLVVHVFGMSLLVSRSKTRKLVCQSVGDIFR